MEDKTKIKSIGMGSIYVDDFTRAIDFYKGLLGLEGEPSKNSCYFPIGENQALYVEGGYKQVETGDKPVRAAITFDVESALNMHAKLNSAGVKVIQNEPMKMGENIFWFQCYDPAGNIIEFLGGE